MASAQKVIDLEGHYISGKKVAIRNYRKNVKNAKSKATNQVDHSTSIAGNNHAFNEDDDEDVEEADEHEEEDHWEEAESPCDPSAHPHPTRVLPPIEAAGEPPAQVYLPVRPSLFVEQTAPGLLPAGDNCRSLFASPPIRWSPTSSHPNNHSEHRPQTDVLDSVPKSYNDHLRSVCGAPAEQQPPASKSHALYRFNHESSLQLLRRRTKLEAVMARRAHFYGSYYGL